MEDNSMPLVQAKCPNCNGFLTVDSNKDAAICESCGSPFIVEKAINQYNINNNIQADVVNVYSDKSSDFEISGGVLKKYNGSSLTPIIPEGVVAIEGGVFENSMIIEVTLPSTLKELQSYLTDYCMHIGPFFNCAYLEKVNLPQGLKKICSGAFRRCESLKEIIIPSTVVEIGSEVFTQCKSLKKVVFECSPSLVIWPNKPEVPTRFHINSKAFSQCDKLETVLYRDNGVLINPLESYERLMNSPFNNWDDVNNTFFLTPFFKKYQAVIYIAQNRCPICGTKLSKKLFSNEYYCRNCR